MTTEGTQPLVRFTCVRVCVFVYLDGHACVRMRIGVVMGHHTETYINHAWVQARKRDAGFHALVSMHALFVCLCVGVGVCVFSLRLIFSFV